MKKLLGQIYSGDNSWLKFVKNGRIHGQVKTNGCVSGRCSHFSPNLGQVPGITAYKGKECRQLFHAPEGYVMVGADAAALEVRLFAHFLAFFDNGEYADIVMNGDIHTANQKAFEVELRSTAKTIFFAMLYGAGAEKIGSTVVPNVSVEEQKRVGTKIINNFKRARPAYVKLLNEVKSAYQTRGFIYGLDRRILRPRAAHSALNTLGQGAGAVLMKKATVLFWDKIQELGIEVHPALHCHDEEQVFCLEKDADTVGKIMVDSMRLAGEHFKLLIPMSGEYKIGKNWYETH
jgi:DNA polymerase I-like protein with 3'-5' exonuclease and polymerase domains